MLLELSPVRHLLHRFLVALLCILLQLFLRRDQIKGIFADAMLGENLELLRLHLLALPVNERDVLLR